MLDIRLCGCEILEVTKTRKKSKSRKPWTKLLKKSRRKIRKKEGIDGCESLARLIGFKHFQRTTRPMPIQDQIRLKLWNHESFSLTTKVTYIVGIGNRVFNRKIWFSFPRKTSSQTSYFFFFLRKSQSSIEELRFL